MKDITGQIIKVGDTVAVPLSKTELRIGIVSKITKLKVKVKSNILDGSWDASAVIILNNNIKETVKFNLFINGECEVLTGSMDTIFNNLLKDLEITKEDISNLEIEENDYIEFEYEGKQYTIEIA